MTLLSDRLREAGAPAAQSRLAVLAVEALRDNDGSLLKAASSLWKKLEAEPWIAKELWLLPYLRDRKLDMNRMAADSKKAPPPAEEVKQSNPVPVDARGRRKPNPDRSVEIADLAQRAASVILFKHKTSDGRDWARVGAHELAGMDRDGVLARAIQNRLGSLSNSQRFMEIGDLMNSKTFYEVVAEVRS